MNRWPGGHVLRELVRDQPIRHGPSGDLLFNAPHYRRSRRAERFITLALMNQNNAELLGRLKTLRLPGWWLASGCLFQTVWNLLSGRTADAGILDYDVIYFDPDLSWEAEDRAIRLAAEAFSDIPANIQVRNQARVHIWYEEKFGVAYPPLASAHHAVRRYPCRAAAVALTARSNGEIAYYAPFGFDAIFDMRLEPNRRLPIPDVYEAKSNRWRREWPRLTYVPWSQATNPAGAASREAGSGGDAQKYEDLLKL
jgi:uncharacterized protein